MPDTQNQPEQELGLYQRREKRQRVTATEWIAGVLSVGWLVAMGTFFLATNDPGTPPLDSLRFVMTILAVFLPVALIWVAAVAARSSRIMREESRRLQAAVDAMRQTYVQTQQVQTAGLKPSVERKLEEIAAAQRKTERAVATFHSIRPEADLQRADSAAIPQGAAAPEEQGALALGTPAEAMATPVNVGDFIRALNFPENAEDAEGFRALRRALRDRSTAQLVQASQDVLTMLSQDGIYMDDLAPDRAKPEVWRRFAQGERGRTIAPLGGIRDRSSLALAAGRMRQDPVFRDSVHHFLRRFDTTLSAFEQTATDEDLAALSDTRTARAFMLLGRVAGTFS